MPNVAARRSNDAATSRPIQSTAASPGLKGKPLPPRLAARLGQRSSGPSAVTAGATVSQVREDLRPEHVREAAEQAWLSDLRSLWSRAGERFPDVRWTTAPPASAKQDAICEEDEENDTILAKHEKTIETIWAHRAILLARAPLTFQSKYLKLPAAVEVSSTSSDSANASSSGGHARSPTPIVRQSRLAPRPKLRSSTAPPSSFHRSAPSSALAPRNGNTGQPPSISRGVANSQATKGSLLHCIPPPAVRSPDSLSSDNVQPMSLGKLEPRLLKRMLSHLYTTADSDEDVEQALIADHVPVTGPLSQRTDRLRSDLLKLWSARQGTDIKLDVGRGDSPSRLPAGRVDSPFGDASRPASRTNGSPGNEALPASPSMSLPMDDAGDEEAAGSFACHRSILASRSPYFASLLLSSFAEANSSEASLPTPPFSPTALYFTLGFIYTGTLQFSSRTFDLTIAFQIWRAGAYLQIKTLTSSASSTIYNDFCHKFSCTGACKTCSKRVPRTLAFASAPDVADYTLRTAALAAVAGPNFAHFWGREVGSMDPGLRDKILVHLKKIVQSNQASVVQIAGQAMQVVRALDKERGNKWTDNIRTMVQTVESQVEAKLADDFAQIADTEAWVQLVEGNGLHFDVLEKLLSLLIKGLKEETAPIMYQTLVGKVLLRGDEGLAPGQARDTVEETRQQLIKYLTKRWVSAKSNGAFNSLERWALKEIAGELDVPSDDLLLDEAANVKAAAASSRTGLKAATPNPAARRPQSSVTPTAAVTPRRLVGAASRPIIRSDEKEREAGPINLRAAVLNRNAAKSSATGFSRPGSKPGPSSKPTIAAATVSVSPSAPSNKARTPSPKLDGSSKTISPAASVRSASPKPEGTDTPPQFATSRNETNEDSGTENPRRSPLAPQATPAEDSMSPDSPQNTTIALPSETTVESPPPQAPIRSATGEPSSLRNDNAGRSHSSPPVKAPMGTKVAGLAARFSGDSSSLGTPALKRSSAPPARSVESTKGVREAGANQRRASNATASTSQVDAPLKRLKSSTSLRSRTSSKTSSRGASPVRAASASSSPSVQNFKRSTSRDGTASSAVTRPRKSSQRGTAATKRPGDAPPVPNLPPQRLDLEATKPAEGSNATTLDAVAFPGVVTPGREAASALLSPPVNAAGIGTPRLPASARAASVASLASLKSTVRRRHASMLKLSAPPGTTSAEAPAEKEFPASKSLSAVTTGSLSKQTESTGKGDVLEEEKRVVSSPVEMSTPVVDAGKGQAATGISAEKESAATLVASEFAPDTTSDASVAKAGADEESEAAFDDLPSIPDESTSTDGDGEEGSTAKSDSVPNLRNFPSMETVSPSQSGKLSTPTSAEAAEMPTTPRALRYMPMPPKADTSDTTPRASKILESSLLGQTATPRPSLSPSLANQSPSTPATTLSVGIPCLIWPSLPGLPPRSKFRALVRFIGPVTGFSGPMVGVELPRPLPKTLRQSGANFNDGSHNGVQYFYLGDSGDSRSGATTPHSSGPAGSSPNVSGLGGPSRLSEHLDMFARAEREARKRRIARLQASASAISGSGASTPIHSPAISAPPSSYPFPTSAPVSPGASSTGRPPYHQQVLGMVHTPTSEDGPDNGGSHNGSPYSIVEKKSPLLDSSPTRLRSSPRLSGANSLSPWGHGPRIASSSGGEYVRRDVSGSSSITTATNCSNGYAMSPDSSSSASSASSGGMGASGLLRQPHGPAAQAAYKWGPGGMPYPFFGYAWERERRSSWSPSLAAGSVRSMSRSSRPASRTSRSSRTSSFATSHGGGLGDEDEDGDGHDESQAGVGLFVSPDEVMWVFEDE